MFVCMYVVYVVVFFSREFILIIVIHHTYSVIVNDFVVILAEFRIFSSTRQYK